MHQLEQIIADQKRELLTTDFLSLVTRKEEKEIDLDSPLAQIVIGVRRSGKSTLCQKVLMESNVHFAYINCDDVDIVNLKSDQLTALQEALLAVYGPYTHLFIDEIQNIDHWPLFVNKLLRQKIHLIITGSNANLLSNELSTHITGRYNEIHLYPFSFEDYCRIKNVNIVEKSTTAIGLRRYALNEYLANGGMPETLFLNRADKYIHSLLDAIINKDICRRYKIKYKQTLQQIATGLLDNFGQEVNYSDVQNKYHLSTIHTAKNYVTYIDKAYLVRLIPRFSFKSIERQTFRKVYAIDNAFLSNHDDVLQTENKGWRLENIIAIELFRRMEYSTQQLFYLRENRNYEVDFAVADSGKITELIQVVYDFSQPSHRLYNREINGLVKGATATRCNNLTLIMMDGEERDIVVNDLTIRCRLAINWLLDLE